MIRSLLLCILSVVFAGCGGGKPAPKGPAVYKAGGTVTLKGQPVEGATVTFLSNDGKLGSYATTDASGKFTLTTHSAGDGAPAGDYMVGITKMEAPQGDMGKGAPGDADYRPPAPNQPAPKNLLPAKYASPSPMGEKATITAEGPNDFKFELN